ncbi:MFS transporter [archaeon]|nr:MAG: MFS transporter [archaeon]
MTLICAEWQKSPYWNIVLLALAWALTLSTSTLLTTVGPLSAKELHQSNSLAAFTIGIFMMGAAVSSVPSGWLFRNYGRFWGFALGCLFQVVGSLLGSLALISGEAAWLYLGCFAVGLAQGLGQFYRFSAVEITPAHLKSRAVTYVLSGGIIAAFLGPTAANYSIHIFSTEYIGSYLCIAVFAVLNMLVLMLVNFPPKPEAKTIAGVHSSKQDSGDIASSMASNDPLVEHRPSVHLRSAYEICTQYMFILSCAIATLAHTIMVMVMSNVALDMQDHSYTFGATSLVMELHFFAMFSPGKSG